MGAVQAAETTVLAVRRNVELFAAALAMALVYGVANSVQQIPILGALLWLPMTVLVYLVGPFLQGGILGMATEAIDGATTLDTFVESGTEHYVRLLIAQLVLAAAAAAYAILGAIVLAVLAVVLGVGTGALADGAADTAPALAGGLSIVILLVVLVGLVVPLVALFFVQFYPAAIVVDDADVLDSFGRSVERVRSDLVGTAGYSAIVVTLTLLGSLPTLGVTLGRDVGMYALLGRTSDPATQLGIGIGAFAVALLVFVVVQTLLLPFLQTYHVAFFREDARS